MSVSPSGGKLMLRDILPPEFEPTDYKLHVARVSPDGNNPLSIYRSGDWDTWIGWQEWRGNKDDWTRDRIFSVMQVERGGSEWVFGGCFDVVERSNAGYGVKLISDTTERLIGRLTLRFTDKAQGRARYLEKKIGDMEIVEIASQVLQGFEFPGVDGINHSFADLAVVVGLGQSDWKHVLQEMKGVYIWNDRATGKSYVGSATSEVGGLWSRLQTYIETNHAGNKELKQLTDSLGPNAHGYMRKHFNYALLEYWPKTADSDLVREREGYWKKVLGTMRPHGYNAN